MGIGSQDLNVLVWLRENKYIANSTSIIEIGAQQLANDFLSSPLLENIASQFGVRPPHNLSGPLSSYVIHGMLEHLTSEACPAKDFWEWLGFTYASIDIDESPNSILLDLNYDEVPKKNCGKYQLVTNYGTTEHIANQLNAFKAIHDLTANGGIMIHSLPSQGMLNHGLINYNPKFFWMLARSNGYKWLFFDYTSAGHFYELPQNIIDNVTPFNPDISLRKWDYRIADSMLIVVMQKVFDIAFVPPLDVPTGTKTKHKILEERYWTVFKQNAFDQLS